MATKLKSYSTTPGSNNSAAPNGWPEGMLPSSVNDAAREMMARLAEWYQDAEWILRNDTATGFTASTIVITGDVTAKYTVDRAIRLDESASKVAIITASSYSAPSTTVTITGYTILAQPTALELGIIDSTKNALVTIRGTQTVAGDKTYSGTSTFSGATTHTAKVSVTSVALTDGANIATNAALGNVFRVTLAGNRTLDNPTNMGDGQSLTWRITQDGTGTRTLAFGSKFKFSGNSTASTPAASVDVISGIYWSDTDVITCVLNKAFA